jgi:hypothetical protein
MNDKYSINKAQLKIIILAATIKKKECLESQHSKAILQFVPLL